MRINMYMEGANNESVFYDCYYTDVIPRKDELIALRSIVHKVTNVLHYVNQPTQGGRNQSEVDKANEALQLNCLGVIISPIAMVEPKNV